MYSCCYCCNLIIYVFFSVVCQIHHFVYLYLYLTPLLARLAHNAIFVHTLAGFGRVAMKSTRAPFLGAFTATTQRLYHQGILVDATSYEFSTTQWVVSVFVGVHNGFCQVHRVGRIAHGNGKRQLVVGHRCPTFTCFLCNGKANIFHIIRLLRLHLRNLTPSFVKIPLCLVFGPCKTSKFPFVPLCCCYHPEITPLHYAILLQTTLHSVFRQLTRKSTTTEEDIVVCIYVCIYVYSISI
jgi:hypothetical protein